MITLRRLGPDDWAMLKAIRLRALADAPGSFFATLDEARALPDDWWHDLLTQRGAAVFGAFDGAAIVGITAAFTDRDDPSGETAIFGMTWLDPAYRGRGASRLYYRERIAWARATGHSRIRVGHRASNAASGRAMRAAGFTATGRRSHLWPDGVVEDDIQYELTLRD